MRPPCPAAAPRHVQAPLTGWHGGLHARRPLLPAVALLVLGLLAMPHAAGHPDIVAAEGTYRIAPGQSVALLVEVHYHRIVGHAHAASPDARLTVLISDIEGGGVVAGPGHDLTVNHLVACCMGTGNAQARVIVRNDGAATVEADVRLTLLHDGFAVANEDSEPGAMRSIVGAPLVAAIVFAWKLRRPLAGGPEGARRALRKATLALALLWGVSALLAAWGMLRYGGGPVVGTLAATADLPSTNNVIMTTHSVIVVAFIAHWITCVGMWTGAARRAREDASRRAAARLGLVLGASAVVACLSWALEYGTVLAPLLTGLAAALLPLAGGAWMLARLRAPAPAEDPIESLPPT